MSEWQPIETAPFDDRVILVCREGDDAVYAAYWSPHPSASGWDDRKYPWCFLDPTNGLNGMTHGDSYAPTHWQPLPAAMG